MAFSLLTELSGLRKEIAMNAVTNKSIWWERIEKLSNVSSDIGDFWPFNDSDYPSSITSVFARQILAEEFKTFYLWKIFEWNDFQNIWSIVCRSILRGELRVKCFMSISTSHVESHDFLLTEECGLESPRTTLTSEIKIFLVFRRK